MDYTNKMLNRIRGIIDENENKLPDPVKKDIITENDNFLTKAKVLMEEATSEQGEEKPFPITNSTPQFGDVKSAQEDAVRKTVGEQVTFEDDSLLYYPDSDDLVLNGKVPTLGLTFQFRFQDPSGDGIYIWANALQMSESNTATLGKVRDAFLNWKTGLVENGDLLDKLGKVAKKNKGF